MDSSVNQVRRDAAGQGAHVREMELPPQIAPQGSQRGLMPLQGFGVAPAGTHLLHIGRDGLLKRDQGKMTGLVLPGGAARRAGGWDVHEVEPARRAGQPPRPLLQGG